MSVEAHDFYAARLRVAGIEPVDDGIFAATDGKVTNLDQGFNLALQLQDSNFRGGRPVVQDVIEDMADAASSLTAYTTGLEVQSFPARATADPSLAVTPHSY